MSLSLSQILALLLCWLAYAVLHSLLASLWLKRAVAVRLRHNEASNESSTA